jgi:hypothetical protein
MKIENARISILINSDFTEIEIFDTDANVTLAEVRLTPEQLSKILSRQSRVECECHTGDLKKIGKKHESKYFEFEITRSDSRVDLILTCNEALFEQEMYEWEPDHYYNSQNSFFSKDGKRYARTVIRRWI